MSNEEKVFYGFMVVVIGLLGVVAFKRVPSSTEFVGSVARANEYQTTTTHPSFSAAMKIMYLTTSTGGNNLEFAYLKSGTLGSYIQTGTTTGPGSVYFYDATTTNVNLRSAALTTSTILIGSVPVSSNQLVHVFDAVYKYGLIVFFDDKVPTSTITYR